MNAVMPKVMINLDQLLCDRADQIVHDWMMEVNRSFYQAGTSQVTYVLVHRYLPDIIDAIACQPSLAVDDFRIEPGFEMAEMLRMFSTLRTVIISTLLPQLNPACSLSDSSSDYSLNVATLLNNIDTVLNSLSARAIQQYTDYQLTQADPIRQELLASNQELISLVQMQKDNTSHLAHELKNPLHAIISFSSILLRRKEKSSTKDAAEEVANLMEVKQLNRILDNAQRLSRLVGNMLEVSRQESERGSLKTESVDVARLVQSVVESFAAELSEKNLTLTVECDRNLPQISTDSLRLQQIIINLLSNAIRYTDQGSVRIHCYPTANQCWAMTIEDTGNGIRADQQTKIFDPYFRIGKEDDQIAESSGLGLTIVSKLVSLLQGKIELVSELGKGSTFKVTLPIES